MVLQTTKLTARIQFIKIIFLVGLRKKRRTVRTVARKQVLAMKNANVAVTVMAHLAIMIGSLTTIKTCLLLEKRVSKYFTEIKLGYFSINRVKL